MIGVAAAATIACGAACGALVEAERRCAHRPRIVAKLVASAAFLVAATAIARTSPYATWMMIGLVLGAIGDAFLLGHDRRTFLGGLVAFLLGHLAYIVGLAQLVPPGSWVAAAGALAALPIGAGALALALLWPRLGSLRIPVIVYVTAIAAMVVGALAAAGAGALPDPQRTRLVAGASLFFVSDLAVARNRFVSRTFANKAWGLPAYYAGQLLIAWSLG